MDLWTSDILARCQIATQHNQGHPKTVWSTSERLAVALVLYDHDHMWAMGYTADEAQQRVADAMRNPPADFNAWLDTIRAALDELRAAGTLYPTPTRMILLADVGDGFCVRRDDVDYNTASCRTVTGALAQLQRAGWVQLDATVHQGSTEGGVITPGPYQVWELTAVGLHVLEYGADDVVVIPGPEHPKPPYGSPERAAYDAAEGDQGTR